MFWEFIAELSIAAITVTAVGGLIFGGIVSFMTRKDNNARAEKLEADNVKLARALDRANMKVRRYQCELAQARDELKVYRREHFEANAENFIAQQKKVHSSATE